VYATHAVLLVKLMYGGPQGVTTPISTVPYGCGSPKTDCNHVTTLLNCMPVAL